MLQSDDWKDYFPIAAIPFGYSSQFQKASTMDFTQIKYFLAVSRSLNFTKAAETCAVSQPALSKSIRKLEENLGSNLFDRNSHMVTLTEFGHTMRVHFEQIEENLQKARRTAQVASVSASDKLNIGIMCTISPHHFGRFLQIFRSHYPDIEITLHDITAELIPELLLSGSLDCIFCASTNRLDHRFEIIDLLEEQMVVAFSDDHKFNELDSVSLAEIAGESYLDRLHCEFRNEFINFTKTRGLSLSVAVSSEREDWILELIIRGMGVSVLPLSLASSHSVAYRPIRDLTDLRNLKLVFINSATLTPALSAFQDDALAFDWI